MDIVLIRGFHLLKSMKEEDIVKLLLAADDSVDKEQLKVALEYAIERNHKAIVKLLKEY